MGDKLGDLISVSKASLVTIDDDWAGYNEFAPLLARHELSRDARGGFTGTSRFSLRSEDPTCVDVRLTPRTANRFLERLANAPIVDGPYEPFWDHTDDCPSFEIALHVPASDRGSRAAVAVLYSTSQGEFNAPWGVFCNGRLLKSESDAIGRALASIARPLKRSTLDQMLRRAMS